MHWGQGCPRLTESEAGRCRSPGLLTRGIQAPPHLSGLANIRDSQLDSKVWLGLLRTWRVGPERMNSENIPAGCAWAPFALNHPPLPSIDFLMEEFPSSAGMLVGRLLSCYCICYLVSYQSSREAQRYKKPGWECGKWSKYKIMKTAHSPCLARRQMKCFIWNIKDPTFVCDVT